MIVSPRAVSCVYSAPPYPYIADCYEHQHNHTESLRPNILVSLSFLADSDSDKHRFMTVMAWQNPT